MQSRTALAWIILSLTLVVLFLLNVSLGSVSIPVHDIISILTGTPSGEASWKEIIWDFRMPKAITCILAGGALSLAGLQMQTLFRNPLAGPDVLGLTSGASLAVSLVLMGQTTFGLAAGFQNQWTVVTAACLGCAVVGLLMFLVARKVQGNVSLLIVGLMVGAGTASVVSVLQYLSRADDMQVYLIWTFGSLGSLSWGEIKVLTALLIIGTIVALRTMKALNAWLLGDLYARSLGIDLRQSRLLIIVSTSLLTGGVTAFCGPIAFVGLAVPHLVRIIIRTNDHKRAIPAVVIGGGILVLVCDILARLPGATHVLPINAITALIGAPVVIWVVVRNRRLRM